ncbi:MAG: hypothetical protein H7834_11260 [Magnetococcus sp. YQC-9]
MQGRECRAEMILGRVVEIRYGRVDGRAPLQAHELRDFKVLVSNRAQEIVTKWVDFFVYYKSITPERIQARLS